MFSRVFYCHPGKARGIWGGGGQWDLGDPGLAWVAMRGWGIRSLGGRASRDCLEALIQNKKERPGARLREDSDHEDTWGLKAPDTKAWWGMWKYESTTQRVPAKENRREHFFPRLYSRTSWWLPEISHTQPDNQQQSQIRLSLPHPLQSSWLWKVCQHAPCCDQIVKHPFFFPQGWSGLECGSGNGAEFAIK